MVKFQGQQTPLRIILKLFLPFLLFFSIHCYCVSSKHVIRPLSFRKSLSSKSLIQVNNARLDCPRDIIKLFNHESEQDAISEELMSSDVSYLDIKTLSSEHSSPSNLHKSASKDIEPNHFDSNQFGDMFSQCAPYIALHRNSIVVIHISSNVLADRKTFDEIFEDISILHLLGVRIVVIGGVKSVLDEKLFKMGKTPSYHRGVRITDEATMSVLKEVSGYARFQIETALSKGFRGLTGQRGINVVSGNFFYSAKPFGVRSGIDYEFTGDVRKIEVENIKTRLEYGDVVMLTSLGYSPSGEVFNVQSEALAAECAGSLQAAKIIYLTNGEVMIDKRTDKVVQNLRLSQAISLLELFSHCDEDSGPSSYDSAAVLPENNTTNSNSCILTSDYLRIIRRSVKALKAGVRRAHLLTPTRGAILKELYTRDGAGMLISRDVYEGIRLAHPADLRDIQAIIQPLVDEGILVPRSRDRLEKDLSDTFLLTRDSAVLGCGMLKKYTDTYAEISCLAVSPQFRRAGRGETLLAYLERRALLMGVTSVFVLSTHTMSWFEERGFVLSDPSLLPPNREYNAARASKVYIKKLGSQRDVDAEELLWNVQ